MIYDILYKTLIGAKPLCIMFDKVDGFIRDYDRTKYLVLLALEKCNVVCDRIRYRTELESGVKYVLFHLIITQQSILIQMMICF